MAAAVLAAGLVATLAGASTAGESTGAGQRRVLVTRVAEPITPVIADHLRDGIRQAERGDYEAYVVRLDTPGGLDSSMRSIIQDIFASEVPVIVHISPQGARGASAGALITFSAHVAAMAPGTAIGAATPIGGQGGEDLEDKIINDAIAYAEAIAELRDRDVEFITDTVRDGRSASASEALELGAIDVVAASTEELLDAVDGRAVEVGAADRRVTLRTADAVVDDHDMGLLRAILQRLADPNVAFLLLSIGTLGLIYELASPGVGVAGGLGLIMVLLGMFGLAVLPVDIVGVVFLVLAGVMFVAEVFAPGIGLAAAGGVLSLVLSGVFLFDDAPGLELSLAVALPTALLVGGFVVVAGRLALRARTAPSSTTGAGTLVGWTGPVRMTGGRPQVFVAGAWWGVRPRDPTTTLADGDEVEVVDVDGLHLIVIPTVTAGEPEPTQKGVS